MIESNNAASSKCNEQVRYLCISPGFKDEKTSSIFFLADSITYGGLF